MAFEDRATRRQRVRYNSANDDNLLTYPFTDRGAKVTPASATITIYASGSTTALVSAAAMTVSGTLLTYALSTTTTASWPVQNGYRADLVVTVGSGAGAVTHERHFLFDVVKYILEVNVTRDQLIEIDDNITAMAHGSDEDFSPAINHAKDIVQAKLEAKVIGEKKLLQDMILDSSGLEIAVAYRALSQIWQNKRDTEARDYYATEFDRLMEAILSTIRYDDDLDGSESAEIGGIQQIRLVT